MFSCHFLSFNYLIEQEQKFLKFFFVLFLFFFLLHDKMAKGKEQKYISV